MERKKQVEQELHQLKEQYRAAQDEAVAKETLETQLHAEFQEISNEKVLSFHN